jgi:signal transduction histidine kinase/ActR/RegA family two-component response regulator
VALTDRDIFYQCNRRLLDTREPQTCDLRLVQRKGNTLWVRMVVSAANGADGVFVQRMMFNDVTERHRLNQDLRDKNAELERARFGADQANQAKSAFLSNMSHELRSPLNAILGFAQLLETGEPLLTPGQDANVKQILRSGWYLLDLINEILDLATVESGKLALTNAAVDLSELFEDCRTMLEPLGNKGGITLIFPEKSAGCVVCADPMRLKQVLVNLLSNAIKYNRPAGSVVVTCSPVANQRIRITVVDTGYGLSAIKLSHIFEPFNRLGQEANDQEGTGIGLAISRRLAVAMGGYVGVESTEGVGSAFWIELDRATMAVQGQEMAASIIGAAAGTLQQDPALRPRTLLYVEDSKTNLELVEQLIGRRTDLRMISATDGLSGIAAARLYTPEVILMDINLPGMSGIQALARLRNDSATCHIPVVAVSANAMLSDIEAGLAAGFLRYLTKPIRIREFQEAIDQALQLAQSQTTAATVTQLGTHHA